ncbi:hypothetical protein EVAR_61971_1 [Eumeta japonica]|uniref:Uncharacterized protein n=1 Tax=Eumeta variegata TaxID=151549 RepID=A0A4C1ZTD7_EUMVA|nr:hypothetical protein EVAR_61971_1 [Eumeta japonica]
MSVWCLILLTANMCMCAFADVGAIPLRVDGGGFDEGQVSPRRERLVQLLAELIERHGPLGLWTHPDEGFQVASGGGERGSSSSWLGGDGGRGGGDVYGRANAPTNRGVSSASVSGRPAHRPRIDYDASDFYDRSDERPATEYRSRGGAGAREPKGKKTLSREYTEPQPPSSRGSNVPSRGDGGDRGDGHGRPITINRDRYRDSYSRDNYNRPGGGARSGNVFGPRREGIAKGHASPQPGEGDGSIRRYSYGGHITIGSDRYRDSYSRDNYNRPGGGARSGNVFDPRREGIAKGDTSFQPGEDCDEDEDIDTSDEDSLVNDQRSSFKSSNVYLGPVPRTSRPKSSRLNRPSGRFDDGAGRVLVPTFQLHHQTLKIVHGQSTSQDDFYKTKHG